MESDNEVMIKSLNLSRILVRESSNPESKDVIAEHRSIPEVDNEQFLLRFSSLFLLVFVFPLDFPEHGIQPISFFDLLLLLLQMNLLFYFVR